MKISSRYFYSAFFGIALFALFSTCHIHAQTVKDEGDSRNDADTVSNNKLNSYGQFEGKIIRSVRVNKAGRKLQAYDLFFQTGNEEYFIKFNEKTIAPKDVESLVQQRSNGEYESETIKIAGEIGDGLWDTDDPRQQSRVGKYIMIYAVLEK